MASSHQKVNSLIAAGLESQVYLPGDDRYIAREKSYFDKASRVPAAAYVQPRDASEVSAAIKALVATKQPFAVRSGGCNTAVDSNNLKDGVTIDLGLMNSVEYNAATETALIGPGATWLEVYDALEKHDRFVGGGRASKLGVGGYLLSGGLSYLSGRHGLACDTVVAYEVVLANGDIVNVTANQHPDLFQVLKGGGSNFGIVTRFTMPSYPIQGKFWGGVTLKAPEHAQTAAKALQNFTEHAAEDPDSTIILVAAHNPALGGDGVLSLCFNAAGVEKPKAFDQILEIPENFGSFATGKVQEMLPFSDLPADRHNIWYTLSVKNDVDVIAKAFELLYKLAKEFQAKILSNEFSTHIAFQPIPRLYRDVSKVKNVLGLENYPHDVIMLQFSASVQSSELADWARPHIKNLVADLKEFAGEDRLCPWLYIAYAETEQKVLESYGSDNIAKIREVAARYDPEGVFLHLFKGGFKIDDVKI